VENYAARPGSCRKPPGMRYAGGRKEGTPFAHPAFKLSSFSSTRILRATGKLLFLEGRLQTRKYDDREGNARKAIEVVVSQLRLLAGGNGSANGKDERKEGMTPRQRQAAPAHDASSLGSDVPF